ncbi:MAG: hypothetical protein JJ974_04970 [Phycisphaerales bacterium]|nr:hypothetical protein [Phycisphaerales bacterium]
MEHPKTNPIQTASDPAAGTNEIKPAPQHQADQDPIGSILPTASANQLLSLIAQGEDASDLNTLINNAA